MANQNILEPMLEMFIFETSQLIEQLEQLVLNSEKSNCLTESEINEIFRIMHTIKGSSAMMLFNNISTLAHAIEDLFYFIRQEKKQDIDFSALFDLVLEGVDFIKVEIEKIKQGMESDGDANYLIDNIKGFLFLLNENKEFVKESKPQEKKQQQYYIAQNKPQTNSNYKNTFKATIYFQDGCEMENIRAYTILHNLKEITEEFYGIPENVMEDDETIQCIREQGFKIFFKTNHSYEEMADFFMQTVFLRDLELEEIKEEKEVSIYFEEKNVQEENQPILIRNVEKEQNKRQNERGGMNSQGIISVNIAKLDKLMDLMGEMVIAEAMVTQNPDLKGLKINNFMKAARQLRKITSELQDTVMSIRMVPLKNTFHKMNRIVRDMSKKLNKEVNLEIIGEETEVDKNIIEQISDPLMHLVRNAVDHGIESKEERILKEKPREGKVTLEAKNAGSDVLVLIKDDGKGLNKDKILQKARENNLLQKNENEMSDKEIFNLILLPGFSTKDNITEYSGRGVGMDVAIKNIQNVGGTVTVDSVQEIGTTITLKIPLTLAIIDGMNIGVGTSRYTLPTIAIKECFRPKEEDIIKDPEQNEMIMVRGQCYPIIRLHEVYRVNTDITMFSKGILIMVQQEEKSYCIFADALLGQQQVVVKPLPSYIKNTKKIEGLAGCTLLGDGNISLILDIERLGNIKNSDKKQGDQRKE